LSDASIHRVLIAVGVAISGIAALFLVFGGLPVKIALGGPYPGDEANFKCYRAVGFHFDVDDPDLLLDDQFQVKEAELGAPNALCNPVEKDDDGAGGGAGNFVEADHYGCFEIDQEGFFFDFVDVENQFGDQELLLKQADQLCVRSEKEGDDGGPEIIGVLDQMKCYRAVWTDWEDFEPIRVELEDQFRETEALVLWPVSLCTPVEVFDEQFQVNGQGSDAGRDGEALVCYRIWEPGLEVNFVEVNNLVDSYDLLVLWAQTLCVPTDKLED